MNNVVFSRKLYSAVFKVVEFLTFDEFYFLNL